MPDESWVHKVAHCSASIKHNNEILPIYVQDISYSISRSSPPMNPNGQPSRNYISSSTAGTAYILINEDFRRVWDDIIFKCRFSIEIESVDFNNVRGKVTLNDVAITNTVYNSEDNVRVISFIANSGAIYNTYKITKDSDMDVIDEVLKAVESGQHT